MELQLLHSVAPSSDRHEAGLRVTGDEGELPKARAAAGDGLEAAIDDVRVEEAALTYRRVGVGVDRDRERTPGKQDAAPGSYGRRGREGARDEVELSEVGEAEEEAAAVEEGPVEEGKGVAQAADEAEPSLADEGGGEAEGVRYGSEDAEEELVGEQRGEVGAAAAAAVAAVPLPRRGIFYGRGLVTELHLEDHMLEGFVNGGGSEPSVRPAPQAVVVVGIVHQGFRRETAEAAAGSRVLPL